MKLKFIVKQGSNKIATFKDGQRAINFNIQLCEKGFSSKVYVKCKRDL